MKTQQETCYLFGASGHAKVVIDIIEREGRYVIGGLFDDNHILWGQEVFGYKVIGGLAALDGHEMKMIIAIGHNDIRHRVSRILSDRGVDFGRALHPSASVSRGVVIGHGTVVMASAVINADTTIGEHVIINTAASVDHDCAVGNLTHIAPGVRLCGGVTVGERTLIGAGAVIIPNIRIGSDVTVGAGATVINDVPDGVTVVGIPARMKKIT
ncbi:serine acetyltransferase-like protein [Candidatus Vecturithrix granuli]|uniref:Serine acetyltransferase-like protein n=1 Tax=Vecturithrix granuli TaxID=1499967 RepID=A0A081BXT7_VECG1|nr:serine acetyltransferase-like protein [Candidatus Vecturithrix granuli]